MLKTLPQLISEVASGIRRLEAADAKAELQGNNGLIIDVREPAEVSAKAARGTLNIPRGLLEMKVPEVCKDVQHPIYLHCAAGGRACLAAEQLVRLGYENVTAITCHIDKVVNALDGD